MDQENIVTILQSLASEPRLDIYRLLVRENPEGLVAGEIAGQLGIPPTNLSFHLKALTHADLLSVTSEGRFQRYRANMLLMVELIGYLTEECCAGHPEDCLPEALVNVPVDRGQPGRRHRKVAAS
ncbi:MAG TPA: ArsR family transcriptional regulator [Sneathiellales bacterium]|nr:ArsR family transcriptional regulator [Sneathiellales bacterium]